MKTHEIPVPHSELTWTCPACGKVRKALLFSDEKESFVHALTYLIRDHIQDGCSAYQQHTMIKPDPDHRQRISDEEEEMERKFKAIVAELHERSDQPPEPGKAFKAFVYIGAILFLAAVVMACIGLGVACVFYIFKP